ncbi:MAG: hypothetical protein JJU45_19505 [Acidimicrobiia bacterium]|nr:hypothetical protein [Acidimicrobiia bacterium]
MRLPGLGLLSNLVLAGFPNPVNWVIDEVGGFVDGAATAGFELVIGGLVAWVIDAVVWVVGGVFAFFIDATDPNVHRQMRPGDALLVHGTLPPAHVRTRPFYRDCDLAARAAHPVAEPTEWSPSDCAVRQVMSKRKSCVRNRWTW